MLTGDGGADIVTQCWEGIQVELRFVGKIETPSERGSVIFSRDRCSMNRARDSSSRDNPRSAVMEAVNSFSVLGYVQLDP